MLPYLNLRTALSHPCPRSISMGRFNRKSQVTARKIQGCLQEIERAILNACVCEPEEWLQHEGELLIACLQAAEQVRATRCRLVCPCSQQP